MVVNRSNLGEDWEIMLKQSFRRMQDCSIIKICTPVRVVQWQGHGKSRGTRFTGAFDDRATCDFEGGYCGYWCCLEAKQGTYGRRWYPGRAIKDHQVDRLDAAVHQGGIAGLLLRLRAPNPAKDVMFAADWARFKLHPWPLAGLSPEDLEVAESAGVGIHLAYQGARLAGLEAWLDAQVAMKGA